MHRKGALQLSVGFLVIIILSIVVLTLGIVFLRQFMKGAEELKAELTARQEARLEELLDEGRPVALTFNFKKARRGQSVSFGVGVMNVNKNSINCRLNVAFLASEPEGLPGLPLLYDSKAFTLEPNARHKLAIAIAIPEDSAKGLYSYVVDVLCNGQSYYGPHQIIVEVV